MPSCAKGMLPLFISTSLPVLMLAQIQRNWCERRRLGLTRDVKKVSMNYTILADEISLAQYAGMTDTEIVAALNTPGPSTRRRVLISDLQARAMETGVYTALRGAVIDDRVPADLRAVCQTVLDLAQARFADVDLDNAASRQMFGALQQAGIITPDQAAAIDALATVPGVSRATALGLGAVTEAMVATARLWPEYEALRNRLAAGYNSAVGALDASLAAGVLATWYDLVAMIEAA